MSRVWLVVDRGRRKRMNGKKRMDKQIEGKKKRESWWRGKKQQERKLKMGQPMSGV